MDVSGRLPRDIKRFFTGHFYASKLAQLIFEYAQGDISIKIVAFFIRRKSSEKNIIFASRACGKENTMNYKPINFGEGKVWSNSFASWKTNEAPPMQHQIRG